jgi:ribose transport system permease protein
MVVLLVIYGVILSYTGFGRRIYITGGNAYAGRLAGIKPERITSILFINNGVLASLVGVLFASRMHMSSYTSVVGSDLDAITAIILGGVSFTGGSGRMAGVFLGIMLITSFNNGLIQSGLNSYFQVVAKGLLLVFALILNYYRMKARTRSLSHI